MGDNHSQVAYKGILGYNSNVFKTKNQPIMKNFHINGGKPLKGSISVSPAKNSSVAILCASVLVRQKTTLNNMPQIQEVDRIIELIESIGVKVTRKDERTVVIDSTGPLDLQHIDKEACKKTRSSLMLLGALAPHVSSYHIYKTGGCKLGERTVRPHMYALEQLGVTAVSKTTHYEVTNKKLVGTDIVMYESGDTPTENAIMAAAMAKGTTTIQFASSNYMVQDLCHFLVNAGAKIEGIGTTTLTITGVKSFKKSSYAIMPDPIVAMTWLSLGITTKSTLTVKDVPLDFLALEMKKMEVMGQTFIIKNKRKNEAQTFTLADVTVKPSTLIALPDKIYGRPFPGLNIDSLPLFIPILTQAKGRTLVHDWVYENRAIYYMEFQKLGAKPFLVDAHRVFIEGKTPLKGTDLTCLPALRPAVAILIAMIAAKGSSTLRNCYMIERGYENLVESLQAIGVDIKES